MNKLYEQFHIFRTYEQGEIVFSSCHIKIISTVMILEELLLFVTIFLFCKQITWKN